MEGERRQISQSKKRYNKLKARLNRRRRKKSKKGDIDLSGTERLSGIKGERACNTLMSALTAEGERRATLQQIQTSDQEKENNYPHEFKGDEDFTDYRNLIPPLLLEVKRSALEDINGQLKNAGLPLGDVEDDRETSSVLKEMMDFWDEWEGSEDSSELYTTEELERMTSEYECSSNLGMDSEHAEAAEEVLASRVYHLPSQTEKETDWGPKTNSGKRQGIKQQQQQQQQQEQQKPNNGDGTEVDDGIGLTPLPKKERREQERQASEGVNEDDESDIHFEKESVVTNPQIDPGYPGDVSMFELSEQNEGVPREPSLSNIPSSSPEIATPCEGEKLYLSKPGPGRLCQKNPTFLPNRGLLRSIRYWYTRNRSVKNSTGILATGRGAIR